MNPVCVECGESADEGMLVCRECLRQEKVRLEVIAREARAKRAASAERFRSQIKD